MHRKSDTLYEDAMIAATAKVHGLTVATRNVADFQALGFEVFNPFGPVEWVLLTFGGFKCHRMRSRRSCE